MTRREGGAKEPSRSTGRYSEMGQDGAWPASDGGHTLERTDPAPPQADPLRGWAEV